MKMITAGFLTGLFYGLIFLLIEDAIGYFFIGTHYTLLQLPISLAVYTVFFGAIGAFLGIFLREKHGLKPTDKNYRSGSIIYLLTAFALFYFGFVIFEQSVSLNQSMKQLLIGAGIWFLIIGIIFAVLLILIKKKAKITGINTGLYYWSAAIAITLFFLPILKAYSSPYLLHKIEKVDIWLIISLAVLSLGLYLISVSILRKEKKVGWRINWRSLVFLPLIILPVFLWVMIYPKNEAVSIKNVGVTDGSRPNVILILLDALRADHLNLFGYDKITSYNLAKFSQQSVVFGKAYSSTSWTKPSIATLFTGLHPGVHGVNWWPKELPDVLPTLAEVLKDEGYFTAGLITNPFITKDFNYDQGFLKFEFLYGKGAKQLLIPFDPVSKLIFEMSEFALWAEFINDEVQYGNAKSLNKSAFAYLDRMDYKPFFLYLHYMDPHQPLLPAKKHFSVGNYFSKDEHRLLKAARYPDAEGNISEEVIDKIKSRYDDEIRYLDNMLLELFEKLEEDNFLENSIVIICSDHGEELLDHGSYEHGHSMYQELIHVPLIIKFPDRKYKGMRIDKQVGLIDIFPTLLDYLDIQSEIEFDGKTIMPFLEDTITANADQDSLYFGEVHPYREGWPSEVYTVIRNGEKLIWSLKKDDPAFEKKEMYYLPEDRYERFNLSETWKDSLNDMQELLNAYIQRCDSIRTSWGELEDAELTEEQIQILRAMGYIK